MSKSEDNKESNAKLPRMDPIVKWTLLGFFLFIFLLQLFVSPVSIQLIFSLVAGWAFHAVRVIPQALTHWQDAVVPVIALGLAWWIGHRMCRWWVAKRSGEGAVWSAGHSAVLLGLVMMFGAAAIAVSGIAHQSMWLSQTKWLERSNRTETTVKMNLMRQMMMLLWEFDIDHGRLPVGWEELIEWDATNHDSRMMRNLVLNHQGVFLPNLVDPGGSLSEADPGKVVMVSPLIDGFYLIARADSSVVRVTPQKFEAMLERGDFLVP